jgi:parallel beta-helix repeat protein
VENNTCNSNEVGIYLENIVWIDWDSGVILSWSNSDSNTVVNNICNNNEVGILLEVSSYNIVANNTCNSNDIGILLERRMYISRDGSVTSWGNSDSNTVVNNICNNNEVGICLEGSSCNTITNNTCNGNDIGISLNRKLEVNQGNNFEYWAYSLSNTVANNTCNYNRVGIYLLDSHSNTVVDNTFLGNIEHDILEDFAAKKFDTEVLQFTGFLGLMGFAGIILLGAGWRMAHLASRSPDVKQREAYQTPPRAEES